MYRELIRNRKYYSWEIISGIDSKSRVYVNDEKTLVVKDWTFYPNRYTEETEMYREISELDLEFVPKLFYCDDVCRCFVMEYINGTDLLHFWNKYKDKYDFDYLAKKVYERLVTLNEKGYVYNDIKVEHFIFKGDDINQIFIIDNEYIDKNLFKSKFPYDFERVKEILYRKVKYLK